MNYKDERRFLSHHKVHQTILNSCISDNLCQSFCDDGKRRAMVNVEFLNGEDGGNNVCHETRY